MLLRPAYNYDKTSEFRFIIQYLHIKKLCVPRAKKKKKNT